MGKQWSPVEDMPDMTGKVAVVTGGNSGIGLHTVKHLASKGAKVYFTARSEAKAQYAREYILSNAPGVISENLVWVQLDLSDIKSVLKGADEIRSKEKRIDILVNNAGQLTRDLQTNDAGWEMVMAVCHVGHFVLTNALLPLLITAAADKTSDVRVVTISSNVVGVFLPHDFPFNFTSPDFLYGRAPFHPWKFRYFQRHFFTVDMMRYSLAKAANMIFAQELQRRFDERGIPIISVSLHPGGVKSDAALDIFADFMKPVMRRVMVSEDEGSFTTLFAATCKDVRESQELFKGRYMEPVGRLMSSHQVTKDQGQVSGLWNTTAAEVSKYLDKTNSGGLVEWIL